MSKPIITNCSNIEPFKEKEKKYYATPLALNTWKSNNNSSPQKEMSIVQNLLLKNHQAEFFLWGLPLLESLASAEPMCSMTKRELCKGNQREVTVSQRIRVPAGSRTSWTLDRVCSVVQKLLGHLWVEANCTAWYTRLQNRMRKCVQKD